PWKPLLGTGGADSKRSVRPRYEHVFVSYVELHCHSAFSFLDGASLPDELVPTALELGYETLALTDHNSVSGSMEFAVSAHALGRDRLRIELQRPFLRDDRARNRRLAGLGQRLGVPCVATGNVHAHSRSRAPLQDALVAVRLHMTLDVSEPERRGNFSHVLA